MKCPKCGKEIANDSVFCEYCGAVIKEKCSTEVKHVDIRWALLPAMLLATVVMGMRWAIFEANDENEFLFMGLFSMIPPIVLFFISLLFRLMNKLPTSFVLIMGAFLCLNCSMFFDMLDPSCKYTYTTRISWNNGHQVCCVGLYSEEFVYDKSASESLRQYRDELEDALEKNGMDVVEEDMCPLSFIDYRYYLPNRFIGAYAIIYTSVLFILYILYVFIAHKKGWKF